MILSIYSLSKELKALLNNNWNLDLFINKLNKQFHRHADSTSIRPVWYVRDSNGLIEYKIRYAYASNRIYIVDPEDVYKTYLSVDFHDETIRFNKD